MKPVSFLFTLFCCICLGFQAIAATVKDVRISPSGSNSVRVVLETDTRVDIKPLQLKNPSRLALDFPHTIVPKKIQQKPLSKNSVITKIRYGNPQKGISRIALDLNNTVDEKHFILPPNKKGGIWRFVLDLKLASEPKQQEKKAGLKSFKEKTSPAVITTTNKVEKNKITKKGGTGLLPFSHSKKIVMLDPGHGGQDPGAISKSGRYEKDLTLKMARETRKLLEKAGYKVVLTRDSDVFISLRGRVKKAHEAKADLFISIHADSAKNTSAKGLSIYTISEKASDKEAAALAERENKSDILFNMDLDDYQQEVSNVLIDLAKQDAMRKSRQYAELVVGEMRQTVQLLPNAHRFAGFAVLKSPDIPSVLLEMGYLSNRREEAQLQKYSYRQKLGKALVKAVNDYFKEVKD